MSWYESAKAHITNVYYANLDEGVTDKVEIGKRIDNSYPFGERKYFPYKMWLKARKELFSKYGLYDLSKHQPAKDDLFAYIEKHDKKKHLVSANT